MALSFKRKPKDEQNAPVASSQEQGRLRRIRSFFKRNARKIGKGALIALVIIVCWLPALVINNIMGYVPGFVATLGIAFSALYLRLLRSRLDYAEASRVSECMRGEHVDFVLRLKNSSFLLFPRIEVVLYQSDLFGKEGRTNSYDIMLMPFATRDITFSMVFDHIGVYQAGLRRIVVHDLLGLFKFEFENEQPRDVTVLPCRHSLVNIAFSSETPTQNTSALKTVLDEGIDYSTVREYRWGDPIKSIHWKLSARLDYYVTRIYESNANPGLTTVIDLRVPPLEASVVMNLYDAVIESALSLDEYARKQGLESTLVYMDDCGEQRKFNARMGDSGLRELVKLLTEDSAEYEGNAAQVLRDELNSPYAQSNIALCTAALDEVLIQTLLSIKSRHKNPLLFYAIPPHLGKDERSKLMQPLKRLDEAHISYCAFSAVTELAAGGGN